MLRIDEFQINEINVDLRTSGFDNEVLSVDACAVWWEHESFYCLPRICVVTWHREPRFQCGSARTGSIWNSSIDEFQINEINVDLRTSGFDNEVLSVDACAVWWERESFYCLPRISIVTWHREPRFQCGSARTCSIWNSSIRLMQQERQRCGPRCTRSTHIINQWVTFYWLITRAPASMQW